MRFYSSAIGATMLLVTIMGLVLAQVPKAKPLPGTIDDAAFRPARRLKSPTATSCDRRVLASGPRRKKPRPCSRGPGWFYMEHRY